MKNKGGRPTKEEGGTRYRDEFCAKLILHMKKGLSFETFAVEANVSSRTLRSWVEKYPQFKEAKEMGSIHSQLHYEKLALEALETGKPLNATVWLVNMRNRFGWHLDKNPTVVQVKSEVNVTPTQTNELVSEFKDLIVSYSDERKKLSGSGGS